jgi:putative transcriptional regulator
MIRHHPAAEILVDYARGALDRGASLVVACHLDVCEICRSETRLWEGVGGALLEKLDPAPLDANALARIMTRLDDQQPHRPTREVGLPAYLNRYSIPRALKHESVASRRWVTPGIWFAPIVAKEKTGRRTYLIYASRGTVMPEHQHGGGEFTFVLHGAFSDPSGTYGKGDFAETDERAVHAPAVTQESCCLCLISSDAPMALKSWPARTIQRLLGTPY